MLDDVPWDEFFATFEDRKLAFLYQNKSADDHESGLFKFLRRGG